MHFSPHPLDITAAAAADTSDSSTVTEDIMEGEDVKDIKSMLKKKLPDASSFKLMQLSSVTPTMLANGGTKVLFGDDGQDSDEVWVQEEHDEGGMAAGKQLKLFQRASSKIWVRGGTGGRCGDGLRGQNAEFKDVIFFDKSSGQVSTYICMQQSRS